MNVSEKSVALAMDAVLSGTATPEDHETLGKWLRADPAHVAVWMAQIRANAALSEHPEALRKSPAFGARRVRVWAAGILLAVTAGAGLAFAVMEARTSAASQAASQNATSAKINFTAAIPAAVTKEEVKVTMHTNTLRTALAAVVAVAVSSAPAGAQALAEPGTSVAILLRSRSDGCQWQTILDKSEPITWPWPDDAESARITVTGHVEETSLVSPEIVRQTGEAYGSYACPLFTAPQGASERFYTVTLTYYLTNNETRASATLLVIQPGTEGKAIAYREPGSDAWAKLSGAALIPYDAAWLESTAAATNSSLTAASVGTSVNAALEGTSGYALFEPASCLGGSYGHFTLALNFTDAAAAWSVTLERIAHGTILTLSN